MAIYGSRSPFKKTEGKESPLKVIPAGLPAALQLGGAVMGFFGKRKARRQARRQQQADQQRFNEMQAQYNAIEFQNPYEGLTNPYANLTNQMSGLANQYSVCKINLQA